MAWEQETSPFWTRYQTPPQAPSTLLSSSHGHQLLPVFQIHEVCLSLLLLFCRQWAWEGESTHDEKSILWIKPMLPRQLSTDSCCGINGPLFDPGYQHLFPFLLRVRDQGVTVWVTSGGLHQQVRVGPYSQNCGRGPDPILLGPLAPDHTSHGGPPPPGATFSSFCSLPRVIATATLEALAWPKLASLLVDGQRADVGALWRYFKSKTSGRVLALAFRYLGSVRVMSVL